MKIKINKDKSIGNVLFIVEGSSTEKYIIWKIFAKIFDYQVETVTREHPYKIYNKKDNPNSKVFVINAEESNIKYIKKDNDFLNEFFRILIEDYDFSTDNAAIYYLFDRDPKSNTEPDFIRELMFTFKNSRENDGFNKQGILLLSYPSIESFTLSCFCPECFDIETETGNSLKQYLDINKFNQSKINPDNLYQATDNFFCSIAKIIGTELFDIDDFYDCNREIFEFEENKYNLDKRFNCLSLLIYSLLDLGLIELTE